MFQDFIKIILFYIIKAFPKNNNLLVFGDRAGRRFADNSRHLFFYISYNHKNFKCIWISKDKKIIKYLRSKNFSSFHCNSVLGIYYCLRAKYHIYNFVEDDINKYITQFSDSILLWHGVLPKKLREIKVTSTKIIDKINNRISKHFIYPNKELSKNIMDRFPKNKYKLTISNLPRNLILDKYSKENQDYFRTTEEIEFLDSIKKEKKNIFGYFPTWREDGLELFRDLKNLDQLKITDKILGETNSLILIKQHMNSDKKDKNTLYNQEIERIIDYLETLKNFKFVKYDFDLNSILSECHVLISDYSGVIFDFLYLDRPIIIYAPDYKEFKKNNGFNLDPVENDFTYFSNNLESLNNLILNFYSEKKSFNEKHRTKRNNIKKKVFLENLKIENITNLIF